MRSITPLLVTMCIAAGLSASQPAQAENLLPPISDSAGWKPITWNGAGQFAVVKQGHEGGDCFFIESADGGDLSWGCTVDVVPGRTYLLSAMIKTENVQPGSGRGALLNVHEFQGSGKTEALSGNLDWTRVQTIIRVGDRRQIQPNCLFGGWGLSTGRAWYENVRLEEIDLSKLAPEVNVLADKTGGPISPFIYGQFIEHLGRCIYGGIWAEMLEDRKFYFPVAPEYKPYQGDLGGEFPVVGGSPWEILGPPDSVQMIKKDSFVGAHTPLVQPGSGICQHDLGVVRGTEYVGYAWLKSTAGSATIAVSLSWGDADSARQTVSIPNVGSEYAKYPFRFTAAADCDTARLELRVAGGPCLIGTLSLMPAGNVRGLRADTLALLKQLNAPIYRWPGGNFVSGYNWRDGIGDRDRRPPRVNPAWTGVEHNDFGLDEFVDFCREVQAEPMIAANTGFGDAYSAAQEVEYCNGTAGTIGGGWRVKNGHEDPYQVRYWCVGNEMFGPWQLGFMQLHHYTIKHNWVAIAMREADPSIQLVGVGAINHRNPKYDPNEKRGWSRGMLEQCADNMDYLSEHFYVGSKRDNVAEHADQLAAKIRQIALDHRKLQASLPNLNGRFVPIAMDEWNYWYQPYKYGELGCVYELSDALGVATGLHEYFRHSDVYQMAHYAQTVNVIGCIKTTKTRAFMSATAFPLMLYRAQYGTIPVEVTGNHRLLALDIAAAWTADRKTLTLAAVNPHAEAKTVAVNVRGANLADTATTWCIAGNDPQAFNTPDDQPITVKETENVTFQGKLALPPYSVTLYRIAVP